LKNFLSHLAKKNGLSLPDFAEKVKVPYQTVYNYDRGTRTIQEDFAEKAGKILGVKPEEILQNYKESDAEDPNHKAGVAASEVLKILSDDLLTQIIQHIGSIFPKADNTLRQSLMNALQEISDEKARRELTKPRAGDVK